MVSSAALVKCREIENGMNLHHFTRRIPGPITQGTMNPIDNTCDSETLDELVQRGVRGDERALEGIYHRFKSPLFSLICRYTSDVVAAEDVMQDVFVTVFTHLAEVNDVTRLRSWLFRIAVNASLGHLRSRKVERGHLSLDEIENVASGPSDEGLRIALRGPLEDAIGALPERLRMVFLLHDVEGFKHEEISEMLGCTIGTSKSQLFKARLKIRARLAGAGIAEAGVTLGSQHDKADAAHPALAPESQNINSSTEANEE